MTENTKITDVTKRIRERASRSRRVHNLNIIVMLLLILSLIAVFFIASTYITLGDAGGVSDGDLWLIDLIGGTIGRVGAVIVGVYGVQIMFNFARYHMRLANHLESSADALELSGENYENLETFMNALTSVDIDFGKNPTAPTDKLLSVVQELVKKIPTK